MLSTNDREAGPPNSPSRSGASSRTRTSGTRTSRRCSKRPPITGSTTSGGRTTPADLRTRHLGTRSSARGRSCLGVRTPSWSRLARTRRATRSSASALTIENRGSHSIDERPHFLVVLLLYLQRNASSCLVICGSTRSLARNTLKSIDSPNCLSIRPNLL